MVKLNKKGNAGAAVEKKSPQIKKNNKQEKVTKNAKPAPVNRVAVAKAAASAAKAAATKKAAIKPAPKKQIPVESEESGSESGDDLNQSTEVESPKRVQGVSVFVGNLPKNTKRVQLTKLFAPHSKVLRIRFRQPNGGKMFNVKASALPFLVAFVDVPTQDEAEAVCAALNQIKFKENTLRVNLNSSPKAGTEKRTIFIGSLTPTTTNEHLQETFSCCGEIEYVRVLQKEKEKGCKGAAFICFKDAASVEMALELNGGELNGRPMVVTKCRAQEAKTNANAKALIADKQAAKKVKSEKAQFAGAKVAGANKSKSKKGGLSGPKLLAKKVAPRPVKVTA